MYTYLRYGDRLPTVAVVQVLLNRGIAGKELAKDGIYGSNTRKAVQDFQRLRGLSPDGIVGRNTWSRLIVGTGFRIVNAVDITDPDVLNTEGGDIRRAGGNPAVVGSMCNGIAQLVQELVGRMGETGNVVLLRLFGHGGPAAMGISDGTGSVPIRGRRVDLGDGDMSSLTLGTVASGAPELARLVPYFGCYTSTELHGCRVARSVNGRRMIQRLADIWRIPVSAALNYQYAGGISTFRFEGPVYTAFPGGIGLRAWSSGLPDMPKITLH